MAIENVFSFVKVFAFKEGAAAVSAVIFVANDACLINRAKLFEIVEDVFILPDARHLSDEKTHINFCAF